MSKSIVDYVTIGDAQKRIEEGVVFEMSSRQTVANSGGVCRWLVRTGRKRVIIYSRRVTSNGNELTYQAFKGPTVTADGTPVTPIVNRNGNSDIQPTLQVFAAPTVTDNGAPIPAVYMPGAEGVGNRAVGQFDQEGFVRILEPNTDYLTQVTNDGAKASASVEFYEMWAEQELPV